MKDANITQKQKARTSTRSSARSARSKAATREPSTPEESVRSDISGNEEEEEEGGDGEDEEYVDGDDGDDGDDAEDDDEDDGGFVQSDAESDEDSYMVERNEKEKKKAEKKRKEEEARAKAERKRQKDAERAAQKTAASSPSKTGGSPASKKRGRATNSFKLAKDLLTQLETAEDYEAAKDDVASSLWREKYIDVENALADIDQVREVKISYHQDTLYREAVEKHKIHKDYQNYGFGDLLKALHAKKEEKAEKMAAHVAAMNLLDLEINFLTVKSERKRHSSGANADLKLLMQQHLQQLDSNMRKKPSVNSTPPSSLKRQRK